MNRMIFFIAIILGSMLFQACGGSSKKDKEGYTRWAEKDNGVLRKTKTINNISYSLQFVTCEYQAIKNTKLTNNTSDSIISKDINTCKKDGSQYSFVLVIAPVNKTTDLIAAKSKSEEEAMAMKDYMQFEIGTDLKMTTEFGDIACGMVYYEDMYGLSPNHTFNIVFDCPKETNKKLKVSFYDRLFGGGLMNFSFDMEKIENTILVI